jgi:hypothetical protein
MWNVLGFYGSNHTGGYQKVPCLVKIHVWAVQCCWNEALFLHIFVRGIFFFLLLSGSYQWPTNVCLIYQSDKLYLLGRRDEIRQQWGTASLDASSSLPLAQPHHQQPVASCVIRDGCWLLKISYGFNNFCIFPAHYM